VSSVTSNTNGNKSIIKNQVINPFNDSSSFMNSSRQGNGSNLTSNQVIITKNKIMSTMSSNVGAGDGSNIKDKVTTVNGICSSVKIGGNGNDTLLSAGKCNDDLTGGKGADKFTCGEGNDTIRDYNPKEGDIILDRQNCEKIL
jgi:Ca2+-binding RTX toxin-like protein